MTKRRYSYGELAVAALRALGGRVLTPRKGAVTSHEAGMKLPVVVVEFDSYEVALAAYESEEYKKALAVLGSAVDRDFRIAEGV